MNTRTLAALTAGVLTLGLAACSGDDQDPIADATTRCQDAAVDNAKYPDTADWGDGPSMSQYDENDDTRIVVSGLVNLDNDNGQAIPTIYRCTLDTTTDDWVGVPLLQPKQDAAASLTSGRWGGADSPMTQQAGDRMIAEQGAAQ